MRFLTPAPTDSLQINPSRPLLDLLQAEKCTGSRSRTNVANLLPRLRAGQMGIPEWPRAALSGPSLVNGALPRPRVKECAVTVGEFCERHATADNPGVKQADFTNRLVQILCNLLQFFVRDPNRTGSTRAAVTTLGAGEIKPIPVPWLSVCGLSFSLIVLRAVGHEKLSRGNSAGEASGHRGFFPGPGNGKEHGNHQQLYKDKAGEVEQSSFSEAVRMQTRSQFIHTEP